MVPIRTSGRLSPKFAVGATLLSLVICTVTTVFSAHTDPLQIMKNLPPPDVDYPYAPANDSAPLPASSALKPAVNPSFPEPAPPKARLQVPDHLNFKPRKEAKTPDAASKTVHLTQPKASGTIEPGTAKPTPTHRASSSGKPPQSAPATSSTTAIAPIASAAAAPAKKPPLTASSSTTPATPGAAASAPGKIASSSAKLASASASTPATSTTNATTPASITHIVAEAPHTATESENASETEVAEAEVASEPASPEGETNAEEAGQPEGEGNTEGEEAAGEDGKPKEVANLDEIIDEANGLKDKGSWDELLTCLEKAGESADARVLSLRLDGLLHQKKLSIDRIKPVAEALLQADNRSQIANYAMGYASAYGRKPNLALALNFLTKAKAGRKPYPGASSLYWQLWLKKNWYLFLLLIGGGIFGFDRYKKKKKKQAEATPQPEGTLEQSADATTPAAEAGEEPSTTAEGTEVVDATEAPAEATTGEQAPVENAPAEDATHEAGETDAPPEQK